MSNTPSKTNDIQKKAKKLWKDNRTFKERFSLAVLISIALSLVFIVFGIIDLYTSNMDSFNFNLSDVLGPVIVIALLNTAVLVLVFTLLRGQLFDLAISLAFSVLISGYLQGSFLNVSHGALTGDAIPWHNFLGRTILNTVIWLFIVVVVLTLRYFVPKVWSSAIRLVSIILALIQIITLPFIMGDALNAKPVTEGFLSTEYIYEMAQEENILVIVLDRLDNAYLQEVVDDDPTFFDELDGFTQFTNNTSLYTQTFPSVAHMLTGATHDFEQPAQDFLEEAWNNEEFISNLRSEDYATNFYMEQGYCYASIDDNLKEIADNATMEKLELHTPSIVYNLLKLSAYRYAPDAFKPFLWVTTDTFKGFSQSTKDTASYVIDDYNFYQNLKQEKLSVADSPKMFKYIHLHGSHAPYYIDANVQPTDNGDVLGATKGSFEIVFEYLRQLKAMGLYENSTIIITGDHGFREVDYGPANKQIVTGLFVKEAGNIGTSLQYNNAPTSTENFQPTILKAAGIDHSKSGETYFEVSPDDTKVRKLLYRIWPTDDNPPQVLEYHITGDANDFSNWTLISVVEPPY